MAELPCLYILATVHVVLWNRKCPVTTYHVDNDGSGLRGLRARASAGGLGSALRGSSVSVVLRVVAIRLARLGGVGLGLVNGGHGAIAAVGALPVGRSDSDNGLGRVLTDRGREGHFLSDCGEGLTYGAGGRGLLGRRGRRRGLSGGSTSGCLSSGKSGAGDSGLLLISSRGGALLRSSGGGSLLGSSSAGLLGGGGGGFPGVDNRDSDGGSELRSAELLAEEDGVLDQLAGSASLEDTVGPVSLEIGSEGVLAEAVEHGGLLALQGRVVSDSLREAGHLSCLLALPSLIPWSSRIDLETVRSGTARTNCAGESYGTVRDVEVIGELSSSKGRESEHASSGGLHFVRFGGCLNESSKLN